MKKFFVLILFLLPISMVNGGNPNLFFSKSDIPTLKARSESAEFRDGWKAYVARANDLCDPDSKSYADPDSVTKGFEDLNLQDPDDRPAFYGWRLQDQMQNLGLVYYMTGEQKYCEHGIKLFMSYVREFPAEKLVKSKYAGTIGNMMRGFATGYDMFGEFLTDQERDIVLEASKLLVEDFLTTAEKFSTLWRPYHNYSGVCGGDAGALAIKLQDMDKELSDEYTARVLYIIKDWLWKGFDEQGAYFEGIDYGTYGLENVFVFADGLKRCGGENLFEHPTLKKLVNWYVMSVLPGEKNTDARNDSSYDNPGAILLKLASEHRNGLGMWLYAPEGGDKEFFLRLVWSSNIKPVSPPEANIPLAEHFKGRGLCIWRTGWDTNDVMCSIESGQFYPITHNQADKGHFALYGFGYRWACDPGYGCNRDPEGRCQTVAHNCILVDGKGQSVAGAGLGNNGKILAYINNDVYGYALADNTEAYRQNIELGEDRIFHYGGEIVFNMDIDHAYRHILFIRKSAQNPAYTVVLDDIAKDKAEHEYCWQMLSWPNLKINVSDPNMVVVSPKDAEDASNAKMFVFLNSAASISVKEEDYKVTPDDNRRPKEYPRLRAYSKAVNPYFVAILIPTDGSFGRPDVTFDNVSSEKTAINVKWSERIDKIVWNKKTKDMPELSVSSNGKAESLQGKK